jgi:hypothetical protein
LNIFEVKFFSTVYLTVSLLGQISFRNTSYPFDPLPRDYVSKSISTVPAKA